MRTTTLLPWLLTLACNGEEDDTHAPGDGGSDGGTVDGGVEPKACPLSVGTFPNAHAYGAAAVHDGVLYVFGGYDDDGVSADVWAWQDGAWQARAPMPTGRTHAAIGVWEDEIWLVTGFNSGAQASVEVYDPVDDTWSTRSPFPTALENVGYAQDGSTLYVVGGYNGSVQGTIYKLDMSDGAVTLGINLGYFRDRVACAVHEGELWTMGGQTSNSMQFDFVEIYDPVSNTGRPGPVLTEARSNASAVDLDGTLLVIGGGRTMSGSPATLDLIEQLVGDAFQVVDHLDGPRTMSTVTSCEDTVYIIGGADETAAMRDSVYVYGLTR